MRPRVKRTLPLPRSVKQQVISCNLLLSVDAVPDTVPLERLDDLWDFDDPTESERRFEALLVRARTERAGTYLAETLTQLARAQGLQRRFDDAWRTLDEAERALRPEDGRGRVRLLLERGRVERFEKRDDLGRATFLDAWELAREIGDDGLAVDSAHMLGLVAEPEEAQRWNERAMELARSSEDPAARSWVGSLANNMGWARHEAGDDAGAIVLFELSHDAFLADGREDRARIARWSIARCRRAQGDVEAALSVQQALLAELEAVGERDGYVFEEIGECILALGRADEARPYFSRAYAELSHDIRLEASHPERLERLRRLAGS
jgi:tetratricopeptide (TPR) repeat protein